MIDRWVGDTSIHTCTIIFSNIIIVCHVRSRFLAKILSVLLGLITTQLQVQSYLLLLCPPRLNCSMWLFSLPLERRESRFIRGLLLSRARVFVRRNIIGPGVGQHIVPQPTLSGHDLRAKARTAWEPACSRSRYNSLTSSTAYSGVSWPDVFARLDLTHCAGVCGVVDQYIVRAELVLSRAAW
jgi:hypothetical protein